MASFSDDARSRPSEAPPQAPRPSRGLGRARGLSPEAARDGFPREFPADLFWASRAGVSDEQADDAARRLWAASGAAGSVAGLRVLDLGCGRGEIARAFARMGAKVLGVDFDAERIDEARAAAARELALRANPVADPVFEPALDPNAPDANEQTAFGAASRAAFSPPSRQPIASRDFSAPEFVCANAEDPLPLIGGSLYDFAFCHYAGWGYGGAHALRESMGRVAEALGARAVLVAELHDAQATLERFQADFSHERIGAEKRGWTVRCQGELTAPRREGEIGRIDQTWTFTDPDGRVHGPRRVAFEPMDATALAALAQSAGFSRVEAISTPHLGHAAPGSSRCLLRFEKAPRRLLSAQKPSASLLWARLRDAFVSRAQNAVILDGGALTGRDCLDFEARLQAALRLVALAAQPASGMGQSLAQALDPGMSDGRTRSEGGSRDEPLAVAVLLPRSWAFPLALMAARGAGLVFLPLDPDAPDERLRGIVERVRPAAMISFEGSGARAAALMGRESAALGASQAFRVLPPGPSFETVCVSFCPAPSPCGPGARREGDACDARATTGANATPGAVGGRSRAPARPSLRGASHMAFTSGSTGRPKGVLLHEEGLLAVIDAQIARFPAGPGVSLWMLNPSFDASLSDILCPLLGGKALRPHRPAATRVRELRAALRESDVADIPPSMIGLLREELRGMQGVIFGGERCGAQDARELSAATLGLQAYGPTEASVCATMARACDDWEPGLLGAPLLPGTILIEADDGTRHAVESAGSADANEVALAPRPQNADGLAAAVTGEIIIRGLPVAIGYLDDPELEALRFSNGSGAGAAREHRTGDIARFEKGRLIWLGRKDRQFKRRGRMVCPEEIENFVERALPGSAASCRLVDDQLILAVARADAGFGFVAEKPAIGAIGAIGAGMGVVEAKASIGRLVAESLGAAFRPNRVLWAERLPITTSGKTDWAALLENARES